MFEDAREEIAENEAYLKAVEGKEASLEMLSELPPYDSLKEFESKLKEENRLTFSGIFQETVGFYFMKLFLIHEYAGEKAVFIKDVEAYKNMRFESARRRVARLLYERYVAEENQEVVKFPKDMKYQSTFAIIQRWDKENKDKATKLGQDAKEDEQDDNNAREITLTKLPDTTLQVGNSNVIGVYGQTVEEVKVMIEKGRAPANLFDAVMEEVRNDVQLDAFPRFLKSKFYQQFIRTKAIEHKPVMFKDFTSFRVLGRGGFGSVHACRKNNSGSLYAMKCINKRLVKVKAALSNVMEERDVLTLIESNFVTHLKYAFQDEETLYLVMDLMLGGDLKFHLINDGRFSEERTRFYAAQVLLGLEHLHKLDIIYRDLKLENVLLDDKGHCKLSDLGLAVVSKQKIKGYAGTPGYTAPEMIENKAYHVEVDFFSLGVLIYRMLCGSKPFKGNDLDKAVLQKNPKYPPDIFSSEAIDICQGLMEKKPEKRLGSGAKGVDEIKEHPFFRTVDWGLLESGYLDPPFIPNKQDVNAASIKDIGDFDFEKYRNVRLGDRFKKTVTRFDYISGQAVQTELVQVLEKVDKNVDVGMFSAQASHGTGHPYTPHTAERKPDATCCNLS